MTEDAGVQRLGPDRTTWLITFGIYGTRLHGGDLPTVDREHNTRGGPFLGVDRGRETGARNRMRDSCVLLTAEQCRFIQNAMPGVCSRGDWALRVDSAQPDHVHVLPDIDPAIHGEKVRRLIKRWVGQALSKEWPRPVRTGWWAEGGSNIAIRDEARLNTAYEYVRKQRTV